MAKILNQTTLPIIISACSVLISLFALIETIRNRRKQNKKIILQQKLNSCNNALDLLVFDRVSMDESTQSFNELFAVKMVVEKNMLCLPEKDIAQLCNSLKDMEDDYSKVSGKKLNQFSRDLTSTCVLYHKEDFPTQLHDFYNHVLFMAKKQQAALLKEIER